MGIGAPTGNRRAVKSGLHTREIRALRKRITALVRAGNALLGKPSRFGPNIRPSRITAISSVGSQK